MANKKLIAPDGVQPGQRWNYQYGIITVMATDGAYAMVRYPRAMPFVILKKYLQSAWTLYVD